VANGHAYNARLPQFTSLALCHARPFTLDSNTCEVTENIAVLNRCRYNSLHLFNTVLNEPTYNDHPCTQNLLENSSNSQTPKIIKQDMGMDKQFNNTKI